MLNTIIIDRYIYNVIHFLSYNKSGSIKVPQKSEVIGITPLSPSSQNSLYNLHCLWIHPQICIYPHQNLPRSLHNLVTA